MWTFRDLTARTIFFIAGVVVLVLAVAFAVRSCDQRRSRAAQSRMEASQAQAAANSSADAVNTLSRSEDASRASEELSRTNEKDIRNAQGASDPVNPAARDAGLRALCLRNAYRDDPKCRVFKSNPR